MSTPTRRTHLTRRSHLASAFSHVSPLGTIHFSALCTAASKPSINLGHLPPSLKRGLSSSLVFSCFCPCIFFSNIPKQLNTTATTTHTPLHTT
ncbi:hypothetical protein B0T16DRAFT_423105 [Cercophora newfieldiana]|uniref:Uncharacterized protein n=1 Tax=Cercophora newfieldiana TaxID=92897 RepID=A0AA39XSM0_9PEZI|nr:hypothetical protein B0T16DRAFT_423105 [Cercophora newfieldiana]